MRTTRRRRLDAVLLGVGALAGGGIAVIGGIAGDTERITGMWVGAEMAGDGSAAIHEVIDYDFGLAQEKHGIIRQIPGLTTEDKVSVSSGSAPDGIDRRQMVFLAGEQQLELRIGDANTTINGRHRYQLQYRFEPDVITEGDIIAWDAVGQGWTVPINQTEVHIVAPFELEPSLCSAGPPGKVGGCELVEEEPGHLSVKVGSLGDHEAVTLRIERGADLPGGAPDLPAPPTSAPPDPGAGLMLPGAVAAVTGAGVAGATSRLVRRRGRERVGAGGVADAAFAGESTSEVLVDHDELAAMATTEFAPPEGITPAMGGIVLAESVLPQHKVAWLIETAIEGAIDLQEEGRKSVRLVRTAPGSGATKGILDSMFAGRTEMDLGSYDPAFSSGWTQVGSLLSGWQRESGYWDRKADVRKTVVRVLGVLVAVVGLAGIGVGGALSSRWGEEWLPLVAFGALLAGAGFAATIRGWELKVRTPQGSAMWLRVESFRRFLAESEAYHAEEAAKRGVLREYTAWAVAVGEIDRWERSVSASSAIPQSAGLGYVHMAPILASSASSASTAPSSSGSGGGGGSSGGGGGGGGGGSW